MQLNAREKMANKLYNNKRIARNTIFLYIRMFFVLLISLYTSRVVLQTLGVVDYGVYNVVAGFVSLFGFLNATLSASIQRFYNFEIGKANVNGVHKVYSNSLIIHAILLIIVVLLLETFGLWYVNHVMVVPVERLQAANVLFQLSIASMGLLIMQIPYVGLIMAYEKMGYYAMVTIVDVLLKLVIVLILPTIPYDKLIVYSVLFALISVLNFLLYYIYSRVVFRLVLSGQLTIDKKYMRTMLTFSGWNLIGTFAYMLRGQGQNLLLNAFFGPLVNAARGIAFQVFSAINNFSGSVSTAFRPQIVNSYASNDIGHSIKLMFTESKICSLLILTLIVPIFIEIDYILNLWLGATVPLQTNTFTRLVLIDGLISTLNTACTQIVYATGRIKHYQIGSSIVNLLLLPVSWICLKCGCEASAVFITTIVFSLINQIVCVFLTNKEVQFGLKNYLKEVCVPYILCIFILPIIPFIIRYSISSSIWRLLSICVVTVLMSFLLTITIILSKEERERIMKIVALYTSHKIRS